MIQAIIGLIINGILALLGQKKAASVESENEALKDRANSVEDSFKEQEKARKAVEEAKENATGKPKDPADVFGAKEYNEENNDNN